MTVDEKKTWNNGTRSLHGESKNSFATACIKNLANFRAEDKRDRNAYRKNHFLNRGKSHHQVPIYLPAVIVVLCLCVCQVRYGKVPYLPTYILLFVKK